MKQRIHLTVDTSIPMGIKEVTDAIEKLAVNVISIHIGEPFDHKVGI